MKKIYIIFTILIIAVSVCGCGKKAADTSQAESGRNSDSDKSNTGKSSKDSPKDKTGQNLISADFYNGNDTQVIVTGGDKEFDAAARKLVKDRYPDLKKMEENGQIKIRIEPGKDTITLGSWDLEYIYREKYSTKYVTDDKKEPLEWEVLEYSDDGKSALVISKYLICRKPFHDEKKQVDWENCSLRTWLNGEFFENAFSSSEQSLIRKTKVISEDNEEYGTKGGNDTEDHIFLLSLTEAEKMFSQISRNYYDINRIGGYIDGEADMWWLRSPGNGGNRASTIKSYGYIGNDGDLVFEEAGVRPVFRIDLTQDIIDSNHLSIGGYQTLSSSDIYISFGSWDIASEEGEKDSKKEDLEWQILDYDESENRVLLISRYLIDRRHYNDYDYNGEETDVTWESCTLRNWLNSEFYDGAFSSEEKKLINKSTVITKDNDHYGTAGGNDTEDYIFLLSMDEADIYFGADTRDDHTIRRIGGYYDGEAGFWWLRTVGNVGSDAAIVEFDGDVNAYGRTAYTDEGVRPAFWMKLNP